MLSGCRPSPLCLRRNPCGRSDQQCPAINHLVSPQIGSRLWSWLNEMRMTSMKLKLDKRRSEPLLHTPSYFYNSHNAALKQSNGLIRWCRDASTIIHPPFRSLRPMQIHHPYLLFLGDVQDRLRPRRRRESWIGRPSGAGQLRMPGCKASVRHSRYDHPRGREGGRAHLDCWRCKCGRRSSRAMDGAIVEALASGLMSQPACI